MTRCRVCGCTEVNACNPPCSWAEDDLCTNCGMIIDAVDIWMDSALRPNITGLLREVKAQRAATVRASKAAKRRHRK